MVRPVIIALPGFPYFFFHQIFATIRWLFEYLGIISPRRCHLTELPTEVIEEILKHVEWQSLLHVRASCTRLNTVSRSLSVWRGQYARYMTANPNAAPLDAPINSHSPIELENVVLQRSAVEQGWLARVNHPVSMTTVRHAEANRATFHIVEGGRWLLSSNQGSLTAYDLDSPSTPGKLIIPKPSIGQATTNLSVDVLTDTSILTFNIAIEQGFPMDYDEPPWRTNFWQVTMHGCGIDAELRAIHITSFATPSLFRGMVACLSGQHYARSFRSTGSGRFHEIYKWGETNLHEHRKAVMMTTSGNAIRILPNDRLLIFELTEIKIYEIPPFETVPVREQSRGPLATPLYSVLLPGTRLVGGNSSSIIIQPSNTYSLIACTDAGILAVTLSPTASHIRILFPFTDEPSYAHETYLIDVRMGWRRAYIQYYEDAVAVCYDIQQPIVQSTTVVAESCASRRVMIPNEGYPSMMDESSGRVVMVKSESSLMIYYYSLYDVDI